MSMLSELCNAVSDGANVLSRTAGTLNKSIGLFDNAIQDSLEAQEYEREQNRVLAKMKADIQFAAQYKKMVSQLKRLNLTRAQIAEILKKNMPKTEDELTIDDLLNAE